MNEVPENGGNRGERFFEGETIEWFERGRQLRYWPRCPSITILGIALIFCPEGRGFHADMFPRGKAFLCRVKDLPFQQLGVGIIYINAYCVIGNDAGPRHQFVDWYLDPPKNDGDGWDESDIFSGTPAEAVASKISDIERMSKGETLCKYCPLKQECKGLLQSLVEKAIKTEARKICLAQAGP